MLYAESQDIAEIIARYGCSLFGDPAPLGRVLLEPS
jgi:hypothetical protein